MAFSHWCKFDLWVFRCLPAVGPYAALCFNVLSAQALISVVSLGPVLGSTLRNLLKPTQKKKKKKECRHPCPVLAWIGVDTKIYLQGSLAPKKIPE